METDYFERTHDIFTSLLGRPLRLVLSEDRRSYTDTETVIVVGMKQAPTRTISGLTFFECGHPASQNGLRPNGREGECLLCGETWSYRSLEHEWQHVAFGTNTKIVGAFSFKMAQKYFPGLDKTLVAPRIHRLHNAVEDIRVNSLWEEVYPGSADDLWAKWKEITTDVTKSRPEFKEELDFQTLKAGLGLPVEPPFAELAQIVPLVRKRSFSEGLRLTHLIIKRFKAYLGKTVESSPTVPDAPNKTSPKKSSFGPIPNVRPPDRVSLLTDEDVPFSNASSQLGEEEEGKLKAALEEKNLPLLLHDLQLKKGEIEASMQGVLSRIKSAKLPSVQKTVSSLSAHGDRAVFFERVKKGSQVPPLDAASQSRARRLRKHIQRLNSRATNRLEPEGSEIDFDAYLRFRYERSDPVFFKADVSSFGFLYALVSDYSGSMSGPPFEGVLRAVAFLRETLGPNPYVKGRFFWFWGSGTNYVQETDGTIYPSDGFGSTPLLCATKIALDSFYLEESHSVEKVAVILTDGEPTDTNNPKEVRLEIERARKRGMKVFALVIGSSSREESRYLELFGPKTFVRFCGASADEVEKAIEDLILTGFFKHMKRATG